MLNCQFRVYVNLSACTTVISGYVVVVSSFREGVCVRVCVKIISAHQCCWGFLLGAEDCRLVSPFLLVWFSSSTLSPPIYILCFVTYIHADSELIMFGEFWFLSSSPAYVTGVFFSLLFLLLFSRSVVADSATPWTAAHRASLSITNPRSLLKFMWIESVMPSNHLVLCRPLLLPFPASGSFLMSWLFTSGAKVLELQH